jgi:hypothetical protein
MHGSEEVTFDGIFLALGPFCGMGCVICADTGERVRITNIGITSEAEVFEQMVFLWL